MKNTTVQISVGHRNMLKKHCHKYGYKINRFLERLIEEKIEGKDQKYGK